MRLLYNALMRVRPAYVADVLKRVLRIRRIEVDTQIGRFWVDPVSQLGWNIMQEAGYEGDWTKEVLRFVKPGSTFVDIGANEGYYSVIAGLKGARVFAVEPQSRLLPIIERNFALNNLTPAAVINRAVSDQEGEAEFYLAPGMNTGASGFVRMTSYNLPTVKVRISTLHKILEDMGLMEVDLMKMDIEGFEYEALLGSPQLFQQGKVKALLLELHPRQITSRGLDYKKVEGFLIDCGYVEDGSVWVRK